MQRKILRNILKSKHKNKEIKFSQIWHRYQIKRYGWEEAQAIRKVGMPLYRKTLQLLTKITKALMALQITTRKTATLRVVKD